MNTFEQIFGRWQKTPPEMIVVDGSRYSQVSARNPQSLIRNFSCFPSLLQLVHQLNEARLSAQAVEFFAVGKEGIVFVAELDCAPHPLDGLIGHAFQAVEGGKPEGNIVIGGCRFFDAISNKR